MATQTCLQRIASVMFLAMICIGIVKADGTIKGRILDQNHRPVEFATAALINAKTKLPIKGSESNSAGDFVIDKVHDGTYILSVSMVGYKKYETEQFALNGKKIFKKM
jgi:hypothetical protein